MRVVAVVPSADASPVHPGEAVGLVPGAGDKAHCDCHAGGESCLPLVKNAARAQRTEPRDTGVLLRPTVRFSPAVINNLNKPDHFRDSL